MFVLLICVIIGSFDEIYEMLGQALWDLKRDPETEPDSVTAEELQATIDMYRSMEEPLKLLAKKKWVARTRKLVDSVVG